MSAFIVSKKHIDAICEYVVLNKKNGYGIPDDPNELGHVLWRENHRSVNSRYRERGKTPEYKFEKTDLRTSAADFMKLLHCLDYQSCEHKSYERSKARRYIRELAYRAASEVEGYEDAPWGID